MTFLRILIHEPAITKGGGVLSLVDALDLFLNLRLAECLNIFVRACFREGVEARPLGLVRTSVLGEIEAGLRSLLTDYIVYS